MTIKFVFLILVFLFVFNTLQIAQEKSGSIKGQIIDASNSDPISNANIYLANTLLGSASDSRGNYEIKFIPDGKYTVIVSCIGYELLTQYIRIKNNNRLNVNFELNKKIYELNTIVIEAGEDEKWQENYELFFREFIGSNQNASECIIEDPYLLEFENVDDILFAGTQNPLVIVNNALGYKILYFLEHFEYFDNTTKYRGYPVFSELKTEEEEERIKWDKNRLRTYCGSVRHFLSAAAKDYENFHSFTGEKDSLYKINVLERQGFKVLSVKKEDIIFNNNKPARIIQSPEYIFQSENKNEKLIAFKDMIQINYTRKKEEEKYLDFIGVNRFPDTIISFLELHSRYVAFDENGRYFDNFQMEVLGYWAFSRIADMLPFEFSVPDSVLMNINYCLKNE